MNCSRNRECVTEALIMMQLIMFLYVSGEKFIKKIFLCNCLLHFSLSYKN